MFQALALVLALVGAAVAQPTVEVQLGQSGTVYLDIDPATPANILSLQVWGLADATKGPDLPSQEEWSLIQWQGPTYTNIQLFSLTQHVYAGTILLLEGCPVSWATWNYVQDFDFGTFTSNWLQERPDLQGAIVCPGKGEGPAWGTVKGLFK